MADLCTLALCLIEQCAKCGVDFDPRMLDLLLAQTESLTFDLRELSIGVIFEHRLGPVRALAAHGGRVFSRADDGATVVSNIVLGQNERVSGAALPEAERLLCGPDSDGLRTSVEFREFLARCGDQSIDLRLRVGENRTLQPQLRLWNRLEWTASSVCMMNSLVVVDRRTLVSGDERGRIHLWEWV